jgi:hypothetical protein
MRQASIFANCCFHFISNNQFLVEQFYGQKIFLNTTHFSHGLLFCGCFIPDRKTSAWNYLRTKSDVKLIRAIIYGTDANAISVAKP